MTDSSVNHASLVWCSDWWSSRQFHPLAILFPFSTMGKCVLLYFGYGTEMQGKASVLFLSAREWGTDFPHGRASKPFPLTRRAPTSPQPPLGS